MSAGAVRLGHALAPGGDETAALREAIEVASGHRTLTARPPRAGAVVLRAEAWLGADPRPVYAYVGDLHPALGQVGLVIERQWAERAIQGASPWELRMSGGPQSTEVVAIAASVGAARLVEAMRQEDPSFDIPPHVTFCPATANREGVGPFATEAVRAKLMGR